MWCVTVVKRSIDTSAARVDLNLLVVFDAIYRLRNLTTAGRTLGLSQPAMSHALARLRARFEDPLFVRLARGLQPTPVADDLAPSVIEGLRTIRGGLERRDFNPIDSDRVFRVGMGDIAEWVHLPRIRAAVCASAPRLRLHTMQIPGRRLRDALGDGDVDLATGDYDLGAGCRSVLLYESTYACVVRADHPQIRTQMSLKQFRAAEHVLVSPDSAFRHGETIGRALTRRDVSARIAVQISHFHAVLPLVADTDLIATIPERLARAMQQFANIKVLHPPIALPKIRVFLYWHERFHREPGNQWLRRVYVDCLKADAAR
jgi:DNA-binding transcriptional LysR family regulator